MTREELSEKVSKGGYNQQQLLSWIKTLPADNSKRKPVEYKVGDILMHSHFKHPYVLLKKRKNDWLCGLLTSESGCPEILEICQSRFFPESYFTRTLFTTTEVQGSFMNIYGNNKHLTEILKKVKEILK